MSHVFTRALGLLNSATLTGDVRAILVMENTTADTEVDTEFVSGFTLLDEYDGSGYGRVALGSEAFAVDLANDRWEFNAGAMVFPSLGRGTRRCQGLLLYLHVTNDADSKPLMYIDGDGFPFDGNGQATTLTPHAEGILQIRNAA